VKRLRWQLYERTLPKHPYRDSALVYGGLAGLVVVIAAATGGNVVKAVIWAAAVFVAATLYSWWRVRERLRSQERGEE
jgi:heme O synthase-like polyprenyltransferase